MKKIMIISLFLTISCSSFQMGGRNPASAGENQVQLQESGTLTLNEEGITLDEKESYHRRSYTGGRFMLELDGKLVENLSSVQVEYKSESNNDQASRQKAKVVVKGWDPEKKELRVSSVKSGVILMIADNGDERKVEFSDCDVTKSHLKDGQEIVTLECADFQK
jgi:hypothetical protein